MLCRAVRRVLNKGSSAEIDAKPRIAECFYSKKALTQLSHGVGGREKQLRSSTQIVTGGCETVLSPVLPAHSLKGALHGIWGRSLQHCWCAPSHSLCIAQTRVNQAGSARVAMGLLLCLTQLCQSKLKPACTVYYKLSLTPCCTFKSACVVCKKSSHCCDSESSETPETEISSY